jgi:hypothetical protein
MSLPASEYRPRNSQDSDYYRCVEDYFEALMQVYDDNFSRDYGFWRPYIEKVICRYLDCGDLSHGFARVKCKDCSHEYLLAFSCKKRRQIERMLPNTFSGVISAAPPHLVQKSS